MTAGVVVMVGIGVTAAWANLATVASLPRRMEASEKANAAMQKEISDHENEDARQHQLEDARFHELRETLMGLAITSTNTAGEVHEIKQELWQHRSRRGPDGQ